MIKRAVLALSLVLAVTGTSTAASASTNTTITLPGGRTYILHTGSVAGPKPLVVLLHPLNGTAGYFLTKGTNFGGFADTHGGFVVAAPQALKSVNGHFSWNSGGCCQGQNADDETFIMNVVADVEVRQSIDPSRIYLVGFSNGGMMADRMLCDHPETFAAAGVAGAVIDPGGEYACSVPIHLRHLEGISDGTVPASCTVDSVTHACVPGTGHPSGYMAFRPGSFPSAESEVPGNGVVPVGSVVSQRLDLPCGHMFPLINACQYDGDSDLWGFVSQYSITPTSVRTPS